MCHRFICEEGLPLPGGGEEYLVTNLLIYLPDGAKEVKGEVGRPFDCILWELLSDEATEECVQVEITMTGASYSQLEESAGQVGLAS